MNKNIIICADDFAQNIPISEGILTLANLGRINAVGCIVNFPFWRQCSQPLVLQQSSQLVGLHFNLTFGNALSTSWKKERGDRFSRLPELLVKSHLRYLSQKCVEHEFEAQLDAFSDEMSMLPDFIDGHQHVHQLPVIRDALFAVYARRQLTCFLRHTSNGVADLTSMTQFPKSQLIALLGGLTFKHQLKRHDIRSNSSFSGIYNFNQASNYAHYFKSFLSESIEGGLIMCHPGVQSKDKTDPQYKYRHYELNYFMSDDFLHDLMDNSCQLLPVSRV